jgi:hypothetical protein
MADVHVEERKFAKWVPGLRAYYLFLPLVLAYLLVSVWPEAVDPSATPVQWKPDLDLIFLPPFALGPESRLLLIVIIAGALGSFVHGATSLTTYLGNRMLVRSWSWWYWLRPLIGIGIALVFYFVVRGGFLLLVTSGTTHSDVSPFGIAAIAGLSGMFSKQATDKLREVFDSLFKSSGDNQRGDKLWEGRLVSDVMIQRKEFHCCEVEGQQDDQLSIRDVYAVAEKGFSRIPILNKEDGSLRYLVHQSLLYRYIAQASLSASKKAPPELFKLEEHSLREFLDWSDNRATVTEAVAFVKPGATVGEAKRLMEGVDGCQDVFVTENGKRGGRVLGWLTNVDIGRQSRA